MSQVSYMSWTEHKTISWWKSLLPERMIRTCSVKNTTEADQAAQPQRSMVLAYK